MMLSGPAGSHDRHGPRELLEKQMTPGRILFIRHAEKPREPPCENDDGVKRNGEPDPESLTVRGWQRAGALAHFFASQQQLRPTTIFASGIGADSKSHRPKQTVMPLARLLDIDINEGHLKNDIEPLMNDVMSRIGTVLVSWEHHRIPDLVAQLPNPPAVPKWPDERFDIVWVLDAEQTGWKFSQIPQMLLAGDSNQPII
jgi:broad specificity phosphatase PhoE